MKQAGVNCANELLKLCEKFLGRPVESVEDLIRGWNMLRDSRRLEGKWVLENNMAHGIFIECGCPLVRTGTIELHPIHCLCSKGMMEMIFSKVANRAAKVEIKRALGRGDRVCEFVVTF